MSGTYSETKNFNEPGDIETAYFVPSWKDENILTQSVAIAPLKDRETSIIFSKMYKSDSSAFVHFVFTEAETDMLISALQEIKNRWECGKVIP